MVTILSVVESNLTAVFSKVKIIATLRQICPKDLVDFFIRNYFQFLYYIFHKGLIHLNIHE